MTFKLGHYPAANDDSAAAANGLQYGWKEPLAIQMYGKSKDKNQKDAAPDHRMEYRPATSISTEKDTCPDQSPIARSCRRSDEVAFQTQTTKAEEKITNRFV